ncbi:hypothetical protein BX666DRAFT_2016925 [Dichotomocladium elegans]|nr:hypothetical protein BX666DRAFT_2016925 [Dichotomocladium elegans]
MATADQKEAKALLSTLLEQENRLQFTSFSSEDALQLGLSIIDHAKPFNKPIVVDITVAGHQVFRYAMQGTCPDNGEWVARKNKTVMRFGHSSFYMGCYCASQGKTLEEKYHVQEKEYAIHGGAFPLIIKDVGVIGTITVSGLAQDADHALVVSTVEQYLLGQRVRSFE